MYFRLRNFMKEKMMIRRTRKNFGAGLQTILDAVNAASESSQQTHQELKYVMVHKLAPGKYQPRRDFDPASLQELSDSIASQGILQPIVVRKNGNNEYEIIAGERRWRAAQMAGLQQVPIITYNISDESALAFGLIENIQRQDLNPIEEAFSLKRLIEEFNMTHEQVAKSISRPRASISNMLRLLNLVQPVQAMLIAKKLDVGHAKVLLSVEDEKKQLILAEQTYLKGLTVRQLEKAIKESREEVYKPKAKLDMILIDPLKNSLEQKLGKRVDMKLDKNGRGKIIFYINGLNDLKSILERLRDCK